MMEDQMSTLSDTCPKSAYFGAGQLREVLSASSHCAPYALEMMSYSIGVHDAIDLFFAGRYLNFSFSRRLMSLLGSHVWIFTSTGRESSNPMASMSFRTSPGFSFFSSHSSVELRDWGVIPELNPSPSLVHNPEPTLPGAATSTLTADGLKEAQFKARNTIIEEFNLDVKTCIDIDWHLADPNKLSTQVTGEAKSKSI